MNEQIVNQLLSEKWNKNIKDLWFKNHSFIHSQFTFYLLTE